MTSATTCATAAIPTSELEDWRYVDCRPLSDAVPASATTHLPGEPAGADALPATGDATHIWAATGILRRLAVHGEQRLEIADNGGNWTLRLDLAPDARVQMVIRRRGTAGRSASWLHAELARGAALTIDDVTSGDADVHLAAVSARLEQDAHISIHIAQAGGRLVRHRIDAVLTASGAACTISAATSVRGTGQAHMLTRVIHAAGATRSDQIVKAVLRGSARTSFDGVVTMMKGADGSSATQQDRNLLLSPAARADTRPQLDIRADEVEASHGATVGAIDDEELLYLRARGLDETSARDLLTVAFLDEALLAIADPAARATAGGELHAV